ncbi:MAG: tonB-system energizer ExbB [Hyphomicrobiales bacterium]|nr:MAG: tonB-system energizer ExbB [Hyphomicrobiales bacterium]
MMGPAQGSSEAAPEIISQELIPKIETLPVNTGTVEASSLPRDLSPMGMFRAADWVVSSVLIGLGLASILTWTIWIGKSFEIAGARLRIKRSLKLIKAAKTLKEAGRSFGTGAGRGPAALMVFEAIREAELSSKAIAQSGGEGLKERVALGLSRIEVASIRRLSNGVGLLAIIGSTSPFVGLFGTVWGIMNAFIGISEAQTTNLAVVAPGIAEALLATAAGLVAAIPAVVIYNIFARSISGYRQLLADSSAGIERLISRDLDYGFGLEKDDDSSDSKLVA